MTKLCDGHVCGQLRWIVARRHVTRNGDNRSQLSHSILIMMTTRRAVTGRNGCYHSRCPLRISWPTAKSHHLHCGSHPARAEGWRSARTRRSATFFQGRSAVARLVHRRTQKVRFAVPAQHCSRAGNEFSGTGGERSLFRPSSGRESDGGFSA